MSKSNDWTLIRACLLLLVSAPVLCVGTVIFAGTGSSWELWQQTAFGLLIPFLGCLFSIQTNIGRKLILRYAEFRHGSQDCGAIKTAIHADTYGFCDALTTTWKHPLRSRLALFLKALRFFIILAALPLIGQWIIANPDMSFSNEHVIASYSYLYDVLVNLPDLNRFELYAVMDTFLLAILTHLTIEEPTKNSIKFLGIILILIAGALATALLFLFKKSVFWGPMGHGIGVVLAGTCQLIYDLVAWKGMKSEGSEKQEHFRTWFYVDLPFTVALCCIVFFFCWRAADDTREGLLAGAILTQFFASTVMFALIKYRNLLMVRAGNAFN